MPVKSLPKFTPPASIGSCADLLWTTREKRYALQKQVAALEETESKLKEHIIKTLPKSKASGVAGRLARVSVVKNSRIDVTDWDKVYGFIKKTDAFDMLQRRLNDLAVKSRWEDHVDVPGVVQTSYKSVSINKV